MLRADEQGRFLLELWDEATGRFLGRVQVEGLPPESVILAEVKQGEDGTWH